MPNIIPLVADDEAFISKTTASYSERGSEDISISPLGVCVHCSPIKSVALLSWNSKDSANSLHTLTNGFRFGDPKTSHASSMLHMRATADFHRVIPYLVDFDQVAIALAEESQRSLIERLLQGHHLYRSLKVALNLVVHNLLDAPDLLSGQPLWMREVKAQSLRC